MHSIDFEKELNEQQLAAVQAGDGPLLVLAAAGTGKTRTLVYRVAWLVLERGVPQEHILLATFTNKAAREMLDRAAALVGGNVGGVWAGTFHHIANRLLRRNAALIGLPNDFTILDRDDSVRLVKQARKERRLDDVTPQPHVLLGWFGLAANRCEPLEKVIQSADPDNTADPDGILAIHHDYVKQKQTLNALDFDDLLAEGVRLLSESEQIRLRYQQQFRYVLVDEYQDTNPVQCRLIDLLSGPAGNVMAVGDDFQCIYSWRGADVRHIMSFPERYPGATVLKLEINYRSVPEVLDVANACIACNTNQFSKQLRSTRETYRKPGVCICSDGWEQAQLLIEHVRRLQRDGYRLRDMAVLYRAHYHTLELERSLTTARVPYVLLSGVRFYEQAHTKDAVAFLRMLVSASDRLAFCRVLELLPRVGEKSALKIWQRLDNGFAAVDSVQRAKLKSLLPAGARPHWNDIEGAIERHLSADGKLDGGALLQEVLCDFYEAYLVRTYDNARERLNDIKAMIDDFSRFESVESFLNDVALMSNIDGEDSGAGAGDSIKLCTVHQAKGLEWPAVMMIWLSEGMFPSQRSLNEMSSFEDSDAEERRLFYVSVTRAKDDLAMFVPLSRKKHEGGIIPYSPSRFITELPGRLVNKTVTPAASYTGMPGARIRW